MLKKKLRKKIICMILSLLCIVQLKPVSVSASEYWPEGPETESPSVILMELSTGTILYEKNSREAHYPASITKILTTLVALENAELNEVVTFSDRAIDETEGSGIARDYGEQMTLEQCLYGVMLASANECAFAVAEHVGGTMEGFVDMMNAKVEEIGCVNTHFANPHGLQDENHYTCAYDMALIAKAAYENETFRIITGTKTYTIPVTNKHPDEETFLQNHHNMLYPYNTYKYLYDYCVGGKTGYTSVANSTLVTYAEKDGMTLVCVVMDAQSPSHWLDTRNLFDYAFDNFQLINIADNETRFDEGETIETDSVSGSSAFVEMDQEANVVLPKTAEFMDSVPEIVYDDVSDSVVGSMQYTYAGHVVGKADIKKTGVEIQGFIFDNQSGQTEEEEDVSTVQIRPYMIVLIVFAVALLAALLIFVKKFADNFYIIRHNMEVRRNRREQYRRVKKKRNRRKRRGKY